jgi:hypothetical protein
MVTKYKQQASSRTGAADALRALPTQATALSLGQAAPYTELLAIDECVFQAVGAYDTAAANLFGFTGGSAALWEEQIRVDAKAVGLVLPIGLWF